MKARAEIPEEMRLVGKVIETKNGCGGIYYDLCYETKHKTVCVLCFIKKKNLKQNKAFFLEAWNWIFAERECGSRPTQWICQPLAAPNALRSDILSESRSGAEIGHYLLCEWLTF